MNPSPHRTSGAPGLLPFAAVLALAFALPGFSGVPSLRAEPSAFVAASPKPSPKKSRAKKRRAKKSSKKSSRKSKQPKTVAWMKDLTRSAPGPHAELRPVRLAYNLSWKNVVKAGEIGIEIRPDKDRPRVYVGKAEGGSTGLARALWPYDFEAITRVDTKSLRPLGFTMKEERRHKHFRYRIEFEEKRTIFHTHQTDTRKPKEAPKTGTKRFRHDFVQDMLSSAVYLRSLPLKQGDKVTLIVAPHNKTYLVKATVLGREKREIRDQTYDTIKLDVDVSKIQQDLSLKSYSKLKKATVWISDDAYRLPLDVQAEIFVGFVSARLTDREWLD